MGKKLVIWAITASKALYQQNSTYIPAGCWIVTLAGLG